MFPDHMSKTEQRIVRKLINALLFKGHWLRVHDGTEFATGWTRDFKLAAKEVAATDVTLLYVANGEDGERKKPLGSYLLIHGNEEDVISDIAGNSEEDLGYLESFTPFEG